MADDAFQEACAVLYEELDLAVGYGVPRLRVKSIAEKVFAAWEKIKHPLVLEAKPPQGGHAVSPGSVATDLGYSIDGGTFTFKKTAEIATVQAAETVWSKDDQPQVKLHTDKGTFQIDALGTQHHSLVGSKILVAPDGVVQLYQEPKPPGTATVLDKVAVSIGNQAMEVPLTPPEGEALLHPTGPTTACLVTQVKTMTCEKYLPFSQWEADKGLPLIQHMWKTLCFGAIENEFIPLSRPHTVFNTKGTGETWIVMTVTCGRLAKEPLHLPS